MFHIEEHIILYDDLLLTYAHNSWKVFILIHDGLRKYVSTYLVQCNWIGIIVFVVSEIPPF